MLNLIDKEPMREGWGQIWQSGEVAGILHHGEVSNPRMIVSMVGAFMDPFAHLSLSVMLSDEPDMEDKYPTLPDETLIAMTAMITDSLACGISVIIHCFEGKYRSTYLDAAVHMGVMGWDVDMALAMIQKEHPIAELRPDTRAQLTRMRDALWDAS